MQKCAINQVINGYHTFAVHTAEQARFQIAALVATLIISIGGGIITGLVVKAPFFVYQGGKKVSC